MAGESNVAFIQQLVGAFVTKYQGSGPEAVRGSSAEQAVCRPRFLYRRNRRRWAFAREYARWNVRP
jgi:hypothetical protein